MSVRHLALVRFRADRATWLRLAREHRDAQQLELCIFAVEGARVAHSNLMHVMRKVPA